jgi:sugar-specific transcriptional regulator TrmB
MSPHHNEEVDMQRSSSQTEVEALQAIGLKEDELRVYEILLERPGAKPADIVADSEFSAANVRRLLTELERKSLVTRTPERVASYRAVAPELAFGAMVAQRQSGLQAVMGMAERLAKIRPLSNGSEADELTVELITGRDALMRVIAQFYESAQHEILEFDRPPYLNTYEGHAAMHTSAHHRSVACRTIVDTSTLEGPNGIKNIWRCSIDGEEIRLYDGVPIKAAIIDRRMALVPLHLKNVNESGLLLRPSLLLDTLCAHFEMVWEMAAPVEADGTVDVEAGRSEAAELEQLLAMLANGLKDKVIASRLRLSQRTFDRRVSALQKRLKAHTRFQAGWNAAMRAVRQAK